MSNKFNNTIVGWASTMGDDGIYHPTAAGLLMFGYEYEILREFPQYFLDYQENRQMSTTRWTDRIVSSSGEWSGNTFDFVYKVMPKLTTDLKVPFVLRCQLDYQMVILVKVKMVKIDSGTRL